MWSLLQHTRNWHFSKFCNQRSLQNQSSLPLRLQVQYLLLYFCKVCGFQYVGLSTVYFSMWTVDRFRLRWSNYKYSQRIASEGGTPKQSYFHQHFLSKNHHGILTDCKIRLIDKTDPSVPTTRQFFWMRKLKTLPPLRIKVVEDV